MIIRRLAEGAALAEAVGETLRRLEEHPGSRDCCEALEFALDQARIKSPSVRTVEEIGEGLTAEEALAIAVYCALATENDFETGVCLAVNHRGDSDSTGSLPGNILG